MLPESSFPSEGSGGTSCLEKELWRSQKLDAVERLAGGIAHDLNNVLQVILGYTDLALKDLDSSNPLHSLLTKIRSTALRSTAIIRQLLIFARKEPCNPVPLNLNRVIESANKVLQQLLGGNIEIRLILARELWPVLMDPSQMEQVLVDLIKNARDATRGAGTVTIETCNIVSYDLLQIGSFSIPPGEYVKLSVVDTGRGMDKDIMEHVFEPFFTTKDIGDGIGLGLSMVYGIVRQNNGRIAITSEPGKGTRVEIYLPRLKKADFES